jgi:hypothetical protein
LRFQIINFLGETKGSEETRMGTSKYEGWHKETTYEHHHKLGNGTTKIKKLHLKAKDLELGSLNEEEGKKKMKKTNSIFNRNRICELTFEITCKFWILTKSSILLAYHGELVSSWPSCSTLKRVAFTPNGETQFRKPKKHYGINQIKNKKITISLMVIWKNMTVLS